MNTVEQTRVVSDTFRLWVAPNARYLDEYNELISLSPGQSLDYVSMKVPANNAVNVLLFYVADLKEFLSMCSDINTPPSRVNYGSFDVVSYMYEKNLTYATSLNISINKIKNHFNCSQVTLELDKY
ncbi:MAG: hypothetical protein IT269_08090 [Saprospiraceae bacterium]|nr:hypothetical protein [Saprospiraceae bacterium]